MFKERSNISQSAFHRSSSAVPEKYPPLPCHPDRESKTERRDPQLFVNTSTPHVCRRTKGFLVATENTPEYFAILEMTRFLDCRSYFQTTTYFISAQKPTNTGASRFSKGRLRNICHTGLARFQVSD